jgi:hypothetical protein
LGIPFPAALCLGFWIGLAEEAALQHLGISLQQQPIKLGAL